MDRSIKDPGCRGRRALVVFLGVGLAIAGCQSADESPLAAITRVSPETIAYGEPMVIEGEGFVGDDPVVVLDGAWMPMGRPRPEFEQVVVPAHVESDRLAKAYPGPKLKAAWDGEAVAFRGSVSIRLRGRIGVTITGTKDHVSSWISCVPDGPPVPALLDRRSRVFLEAQGLAVEDTDHGVKVADITPRGHAETLGLLGSDVILAINGWPVERRRDLGWMHGSGHPKVQVARQGRVRNLDPYFNAGLPDLSREMAGALAVAGVLCGLFFSFALGRFRTAGSSAGKPPTWSGLVVHLAVFVVVTGLLVLVPVLAAMRPPVPDLGPILIAALMAGLALEGVAEGRRGPRPADRGGAWAQRIMIALLGAAMIALSMLSAGFLGLNETLASGESAARTWGILENPMKSVILLLGLGLFGRVLKSQRAFATTPHPLALGGRMLTLAAFSAMVVILGLGAWSVPGVALSSPWINGLVFGLKGWMVILAARLLPAAGRRRRHDTAETDIALAAGFVLTLAGAMAWGMVPLPPLIEKLGRLAAVAVVSTWAGVKLGQAVSGSWEGYAQTTETHSSAAWLKKC